MINYNEPIPEIYKFNNSYISELSNNISKSISQQKDNIIFECLIENNADIFDLTKLAKQCKFIHQEGKDYTILQYNNKNLLMIFEPETSMSKDYKFSCEVRYKKLY